MRVHLRSNNALISIVILFAIVASIAAAIFLYIQTRQTADALSARDFNAGNIISDSVFYNKDTMNVQQIQDFLNQQIPSCDTWGTGRATEFGYSGTRAQYAAARGWQAPPYSCLNNYHENPSTGETSYEKGGGAFSGGTSAAQIIYTAAQQYGINPQVLLVLLKKESAGPLTNDSWPLKSQYKYAMGYACPDSGPGYSANCDTDKAGFYNQMMTAAWQLKYYKDNSNSYRYSIGWNDIQYSPDPTCGTKRVYIENVATLSLYIYTPYTPNDAALANYPGTSQCGAYGNRNFFMFFNELFGSTQEVRIPECDSKLASVGCVWRLINTKTGAEFLTINKTERDTALRSSDWRYEGKAFYAYKTSVAGSIPVYRINMKTQHFFTTDRGERDALLTNSGYSDEGIAFYALPSSTSTNVSYSVYRFYGNGGHFLNSSESSLSSTHTNEGVKFNTPSGMATAPTPAANRQNVYRLNGPNHFYTTSLAERDSLISIGWSYEGVMVEVPVARTATPVYRLYGSRHFYTTNEAERNSLVRSGWKDEGIAFYVDEKTPRVYRFLRNNNQHFYTSNLNEAASITNKGAKYEGIAFGFDQDDKQAVYRLYGSSHFYTTNVSEMLKISNSGWNYEGVVFYAQKSTANSKVPVYRLYGSRHFYTTNEAERNSLVRSGWKDEGIAFYVDVGGSPVYRMYKNGHFYTSSEQERQSALRSGWANEGISWYAN